jgi:hypothetical protein
MKPAMHVIHLLFILVLVMQIVKNLPAALNFFSLIIHF